MAALGSTAAGAVAPASSFITMTWLRSAMAEWLR
jgi:hypothetical protein